MVRIVMFVLALFFACSASVDAGWLDDKLKKAAENVGDRFINDASNSAYEGAKDAVTPQEEIEGQDLKRFEPEESPEEDAQLQEVEEPSWANPASGEQAKRKKKKKSGPPRTDLLFSSDMIMSDPESGPEPFTGKLYVDGSRSRTDFQYADGNSVGIISTGIEPADKIFILMHREKTYMVSSVESQGDDTFSFESGKPCDGFRKAEDLGKMNLNGRNVVKWRCSGPEDPEDYDGDVITLWFDNVLKIPIRMEEEKRKGYWELQNIHEGIPSAEYFKVPSGYKQFSFDMPSGMNR